MMSTTSGRLALVMVKDCAQFYATRGGQGTRNGMPAAGIDVGTQISGQRAHHTTNKSKSYNGRDNNKNEYYKR